MYLRHHTDDPDVWCRANDPAYLEAEGSDLQCRKYAVQRSAAASWAHVCERFVKIRA
jgi:hypothetical protein